MKKAALERPGVPLAEIEAAGGWMPIPRGYDWEPEVLAGMLAIRRNWTEVPEGQLEHTADLAIDVSARIIAREVNLRVHRQPGDPMLTISTARKVLWRLKAKRLLVEVVPHRSYYRGREWKDGKWKVKWGFLPKVWLPAEDWTQERVASIIARRNRQWVAIMRMAVARVRAENERLVRRGLLADDRLRRLARVAS